MHDTCTAPGSGQLFAPCEREGKADLPVNARIRIGRKLAQAYDPVLAEPVPARLLGLLAQLEQRDSVMATSLHANTQETA